MLAYAVAMQVAHKLDKRLKAASAQGYAPGWLALRATGDGSGDAGFYPYWSAFHSNVNPSSSGGDGGGASSGGGGGGGSF